MSGISFSGAGSGIDWDALRSALMQIDRQSGLRLVNRQKELTAEKSALGDVKTRLNNLVTELNPFLKAGATDLFDSVTATSSNTGVLTATADSTAAAGVYEVAVKSLAVSGSVISKTSPSVASFTSSITGSDLDADIDGATTLFSSLHRRDDSSNFADSDIGELVIDDGLTGPVTIDLAAEGVTSGSTVNDSLTAVNNALSAAGSGVTASLNAAGNGFLFSTTTGSVSIADGADGKSTATKLGVETGGAVAGPVDGGDLDPDLQSNTPLSALNGGAGVADLASGVKLRQGTSTVNLSFAGSSTVGDIISKIGGAGMSMTAALTADKKALKVTSTVNNRSLGVIENGGTSAADLGIFGEANILKMKASSDASYSSVYLNGASDYDSSSLSMADIRDGINAVSGANFSASVVDGRLLIKATKVGTENELEFEDSAASSGILEQAGILTADPLDSTTIANDYASDSSKGGILQVASDAVFSVDGVVVTRSQNEEIDDVIQGVSLDLLAPSASTGADFPADYTTLSLTVAADDKGVANAMERIVNQYNSAADLVESFTKIDPKGEDGALANSSVARGIKDGLFFQLSRMVSGTGSAYRSLFELRDENGDYAFTVESGSNGRITFNKSAFENVLETNREDVEALLRQDSDGDGTHEGGLLGNLKSYVSSYTDTYRGHITVQSTAIDLQVEDLDDSIERFEERMEKIEAGLKRRFTAAETLMSSLTSSANQMSSQLASLR